MDDNARYILAIAEKGSISQAAETIHMSQSALSQRLKNEEGQLGVELFDRAHIPIKPTQAGRVYLEWAKKIVRAEDSLREQLELVSAGSKRHLRIGISSPRYTRIISESTAQFCRDNPECVPDFFEVGKLELVNAAFANDLIDFAILTPQQPEPSLFVSQPICEERYVYVAPASWDLPSEEGGDGFRVVDISAICRFPFVRPTFARRLSSIIDSLFDLATEKPDVVVSCTSPVAQLDLAELGIGASIVTTAAGYEPDRPGLAYYDVKGIAGSSYLYYSRRSSCEPSPDEQSFVGILKRKLEENGLLIGSIQQS